MAVTGQFVPAREATFSWTAPSGGTEAVSVVGFMAVKWRERRKYHRTTPVGYLHARYTMDIMECDAVLGLMYDKSGSTPTTPGLAAAPPVNPGTLEITFASGKKKSMTGFLVSLDWDHGGGGPPQMYNIGFIGSAENSSSTIATA